MGVPLCRWMVYFMENHIKIDDLGVPQRQETFIWLPKIVFIYVVQSLKLL